MHIFSIFETDSFIHMAYFVDIIHTSPVTEKVSLRLGKKIKKPSWVDLVGIICSLVFRGLLFALRIYGN
jgi:hypothetical protein